MQLFPEACSDGKVDFDVLQEAFGVALEVDDEKFSLTWPGKRAARKLALTPSLATLLPCPSESIEWSSTRNVMIEGENLEVLKVLQKSYSNKVKMVYIDPPYNTGGDFLYRDSFEDKLEAYLRLTGQADQAGYPLVSNSEVSGRFHSNWLSMMYPRLRLARNLLTADGVIFISIDDHEAHNLRRICDEIFGEENFVCTFAWEKRYSPPPDTTDVGYVHESILLYRKTDAFKMGFLEQTAAQTARYKNPDGDARGPWKPMDYTCRYTADERPTLFYPVRNPKTGIESYPKRTRVWAFSREVHERNVAENRIWWGKDGTGRVPALKNFLTDIQQGMMPMTLLKHDLVGNTDEATKHLRKYFPDLKFTPKPLRLIQHLCRIANVTEGDTVLDFFAGSGTTGEAVWGVHPRLRFLLVQLPELTTIPSLKTIAELTKERLRRAGAAMRSKEADRTLDRGFRVFKLATSNIAAWSPDRNDLPGTLEAAADHLKKDRTEQDILYELLLKRGLDLCVPIETKTIAGKTVYAIGAGVLMTCLATQIYRAEVEPLAKGIVDWRKAMNPAGDVQVIFRDSAFADDVAKSNLTAILCQYGFDEKAVRSL